MAFTYEQAREQIQQAIADSSNRAFVDECLDQAERTVARARPWPELMDRKFFNTVAAYSTGTIAVTVDTTTVTLTSGTWPTALATGEAYRFALSVSDPWYKCATRTSGTSMELADNYIDDTETASSYIVYKSHYSLDSTVDRLDEIWLHDAGNAVPLINAATDEEVTEFDHYPGGPGVPTHYLSIERDSSNYRQILLGPSTPDDVYRVEYTFQKQTTDGTFTLDASRWPVVLALAKSLAYEPEFYERSLREYARYKALLRQEWANENESGADFVRVGETRMRYPGRRSMDYFLGRGKVTDPS